MTDGVDNVGTITLYITNVCVGRLDLSFFRTHDAKVLKILRLQFNYLHHKSTKVGSSWSV